MTDRTIGQAVHDVLRGAAQPMSARDIASALPEIRADSVAAQVSIMARGRKITRHHNSDGILRYTLSPLDANRQQQAPKAHVYAPPIAPAPVRVVAAAETTAAAPEPPHGDGTISLQALVRTVIESQPNRRWTLAEITVEVGHRIGKGKVRPDQVRARLANLTRSGHSSPVRRMPADGTWMVNTPGTRAIAQAEQADRNAIVASAVANTEAPASEPAPASRAALAPKPLRIPQARQGAAEDAIERAAEARGALRTLIASVITHVPDPPPEVILAMQRGLCLFAAEAR